MVNSTFGQSYTKKLIKAKYAFDLLTMKKQYEAQLAYYYGPFVQIIGGKDSLITKLKRQDSLYKAKNYLIVSEKFSEPMEDKISGDTIRVIIKHKTVCFLEEQKLFFQNCYVAISLNKGKKWFFIDNNLLNSSRKEIQNLFPDFNKNLSIEKQIFKQE